MGCPHPLDPLGVAVMLRLSSGSAPVASIAADLHAQQCVIEHRLQRLSALGAVTFDPQSSQFALLPEAHKVVLQVAEAKVRLNGGPASSRGEDLTNSRRERLQREAMFRQLPHEELRWLAQVSRTISLDAGEVLFLEGGDCHGMYIVDCGTIRLSKSSSSAAFGYGREQTIRLMTTGDSFNEVPVFDGGTNPVTAEALEESLVILVPKSEVRDLVERSPQFAGAIIQLMAERLRHFLAMIEDVSMRDVAGRVAKILLQMEHPSAGVGAGLTNGRRLTQREIAEMAGTAREVVARILKKMERVGAISVNRGQVKILDSELLASFT